MTLLLYSFPWLSGSYGLVGSNKKIPRPHLYLTVKKEVKKSLVRRELEEKFKCDAKENIELLREPERKPIFKFLGNFQSRVPVASSSVLPTPGGGVLACSDPKEENEEDDVQGIGTLGLFCFSNEQHFALTSYHITLGIEEDFVNIHNVLPDREHLARGQQYYFTEGNTSNNNEHGLATHRSRLGEFHDYRFNSECDILSVKVPDDIEINCELMASISAGIDSNENDSMKVHKIGFSSSLTSGSVVCSSFNYAPEQELLIQDAFVVQGCSGPFLEGGDSGALVYFLDKHDQKRVFAYGVCEVDDLLLPKQHESGSSCSFDESEESEEEMISENEMISESSEAEWQEKESDISENKMEREEERDSKKKYICYRLDTALENLGLEGAACFFICNRN